MTTICTPDMIPFPAGSTASTPHCGRVLHVVNGQHYAGAARVQDLLALKLPGCGFDVSFATLLPGRFESERRSQTPLHHIPMHGRLDLRPVRQLVHLIREGGFDLVHSHTTRSALVAAVAAAWAHVPYVHHVHCQMDTEVGRTLGSRANRTIEKQACRRADGVIAVSQSIAAFLRRHRFSKGPVSVVPNGVPAIDVRRPRRAEDPWVIGMVALLRERKGLETLLMALPALNRDHHVRLRIVGPFESDGYRNRMYDLSDSLGVTDLVDWTGYTPDVPTELNRMDALVLPSVLPEGMPMVLLEAMAAGVPVLGSRVDGITDVIEHERTGLLFEPGCPNSLAGQLLRLLRGQTNWQMLREAAHSQYRQHFSDAAMARGVARVYSRILVQREIKS
ncbi:MAG: glycosyltransferase family 4 protein [Planctomycetaceae bacterium]|nr:glycosyltransferase family 4 protein [Planctomycetaceae bacterium]